MNCSQFRETIERAIERREALAPEVSGHAETCGDSACAGRLADLQLLDAATRAWNARVPRVELTGRVLAEVNSPQPLLAAPRREPAGRPLAMMWQVAAAASVVVVVGLSLLGPSETDTARSLANRAARHDRLTTPQQISRQYVAWAENAGSLVADAVGAVIPTTPPGSADAMSSPRWMNDWMRQLEPAQRELNQAIMFLEESMPTGTAPAT